LVADNGQTVGTNTWSPVPPIWSPDSTKIAIYTDEGLAIVNAIDGSSFNLTHSWRGEYDVQWSPDSRKIVFYELIGHGNPGQAVVIDVEPGAEVRPLLEGGPDVHDGTVLWLPDSEQILFQRSEGYANGPEDRHFFLLNLITMDAAEIDLSALADPQLHAVLNQTTILLHETKEVGFEVVEYDLSSGGVTPLFDVESYLSGCSFCKVSPDQEQYVAYAPIASTPNQLRIYDMQGSVPMVEIPLGIEYFNMIYWSPDSQSLIFTGAYSEAGLYLVNADGSGGVQTLTDLPVAVAGWMAG
jgi:dipeptidyl aminopeptidase/acylaminoacyl peptidase